MESKTHRIVAARYSRPMNDRHGLFVEIEYPHGVSFRPEGFRLAQAKARELFFDPDTDNRIGCQIKHSLGMKRRCLWFYNVLPGYSEASAILAATKGPNCVYENAYEDPRVRPLAVDSDDLRIRIVCARFESAMAGLEVKIQYQSHLTMRQVAAAAKREAVLLGFDPEGRGTVGFAENYGITNKRQCFYFYDPAPGTTKEQAIEQATMGLHCVYEYASEDPRTTLQTQTQETEKQKPSPVVICRRASGQLLTQRYATLQLPAGDFTIHGVAVLANTLYLVYSYTPTAEAFIKNVSFAVYKDGEDLTPEILVGYVGSYFNPVSCEAYIVCRMPGSIPVVPPASPESQPTDVT